MKVLKLSAVQSNHDGPKVTYNLLNPREIRYGLAGLLLHWHKFEIRLEAFGRHWTVKRSGEDE